MATLGGNQWVLVEAPQKKERDANEAQSHKVETIAGETTVDVGEGSEENKRLTQLDTGPEPCALFRIIKWVI